MRIAISAVIIRGNSILLVKKRNTWILPGGKPNKGESDIDCLVREITQEEIPGTGLTNFRFYKAFKGITPHRGDILLAKVYLADIQGEIKPGAEIIDIKWVKDLEDYKLSDITQKIINHLRKEGYL